MERTRFSCLFVLFLLAASGLGCGAVQQEALSLAIDEIETGEYQRALGRIEDALRYDKTPPDLDALGNYLKGKCHEGLGEYEEAIELYRYVLDKHPDCSHVLQCRRRIERLEKVLAGDPDVPPAVMNE